MKYCSRLGVRVLLLLAILPSAGLTQTQHEKQSGKMASKSLNELNARELIELTKSASIESERMILSAAGMEIARRVKSDELKLSLIMNSLEREAEDTSHTALLLSVLDLCSRKASTEEQYYAFNLARSFVEKSSTPSLRVRAIAVATANSFLAELVAYQRVEPSIVSAYGQQLVAIATDWSEDPLIRRAAIKGISEIGYREAIPNLIELSRNPDILKLSPVARSVCITLGRFGVKEAIPSIQGIINTTQDESIFASASISLSDIGGQDALGVLIDNASRFGGLYAGIAIRKLDTLIYSILSSGDKAWLPKAIIATKYLFEEDQIAHTKNILKEILFSTNEAYLIGIILDRLKPIVSQGEAAEIVARLPYDDYYKDQLLSLEAYAKAIPVQSVMTTSFDKVNHVGGQEYGDAGYREIDLPSPISNYGHAGLYAGIDNDTARIIEVKFDVLDWNSKDVIKYNYWKDMIQNSDFWGVFTLSNKTLTFSERQAIMETAWTLYAMDIGYPIDGFGLPGGDALDCYPAPGIQISPDEIKNIRCDGLVEYCYELNGNMVWGSNASHYDISQTANVDAHNVLYNMDQGYVPNPNTGLAPVVQCGRAGGISTWMTRLASIGVELPDYHTSYHQDGSFVHFFVKATDESGIHQIFCRPPGYSGYIAGAVRDQHPISDNYTQEFIFPMSQSADVLFYAIDNGDNGGSEDAQSVWLDICQGPPAKPILVSPTDNSLVSQSVRLEWNDTPGATAYRVDYGLEGQIWDDQTITNPAISYYCPTSLQPGKRYGWRVRVWTDCGYSEWSDTAWFNTSCDSISSPTPYTLPDERFCGSCYIWWHPVPGASGYLRKCTSWGDKWWPNSHWYDTLAAIGGVGLDTVFLRSYSTCDTTPIGSASEIIVLLRGQGSPPQLSSPSDETPNQGQPVLLDWLDVVETDTGRVPEWYELEVDSSSIFTSPETIRRQESDFAASGLVEGREYFWRVRACNRCWCSDWSAEWSFTTNLGGDGVEDEPGSNLPDRFELRQNYPNPFNPSTSIEFNLPKRSRVSIDIFNLLGQRVCRLVDKEYTAGNYRVEWNGSTDEDQSVSTGVYFYRIRAEDFTETKKMLLMK